MLVCLFLQPFFLASSFSFSIFGSSCGQTLLKVSLSMSTWPKCFVRVLFPSFFVMTPTMAIFVCGSCKSLNSFSLSSIIFFFVGGFGAHKVKRGRDSS